MPGNETLTNYVEQRGGAELCEAFAAPAHTMLTQQSKYLSITERGGMVGYDLTRIPLDGDVGHLTAQAYMDYTGYDPSKRRRITGMLGGKGSQKQESSNFTREVIMHQHGIRTVLPHLLGTRELIARRHEGMPSTMQMLAWSEVGTSPADHHPLLFATLAHPEDPESRLTLERDMDAHPSNRTVGSGLRLFQSEIIEGSSTPQSRQEQSLEALTEPRTSGHDFAEMTWNTDQVTEDPDAFNKKLLEKAGSKPPQTIYELEKMLIVSYRELNADLLTTITRSELFDIALVSSREDAHNSSVALAVTKAFTLAIDAQITKQLDSTDQEGKSKIERPPHRDALTANNALNSKITYNYNHQKSNRANKTLLQRYDEPPEIYNAYAESLVSIATVGDDTRALQELLSSANPETVDAASRMLAIGQGEIQSVYECLNGLSLPNQIIAGYASILAVALYTEVVDVSALTVAGIDTGLQQTLGITGDKESTQIEIFTRMQAFAELDGGLRNSEHLKEFERLGAQLRAGHLRVQADQIWSRHFDGQFD